MGGLNSDASGLVGPSVEMRVKVAALLASSGKAMAEICPPPTEAHCGIVQVRLSQQSGSATSVALVAP